MLTATNNVISSNTKLPGSGEEEKIIKASKEWEAYFVGYMLKEMRKTVPNSSEGGESNYAKETYNTMIDEQIARNIANNGGFGFAKMMMQNLAKQQNVSINKEMLMKAYNGRMQ